jgi:hypothetical protein
VILPPQVPPEVHYVLSSAIASPISLKPRIRRRTDMIAGLEPGHHPDGVMLTRADRAIHFIRSA